MPRAPGTFGTIVAIPLALLVAMFGTQVYWLVTLLAVVLGVIICHETARLLGTHDHHAIVWDEIAGFMVTMLFFAFTFVNILVGFILFRLFDILKPWPINRIDQQVTGGWGMMLDDLIAGLLAALVLALLRRVEFFGLYPTFS